MDILEGIKDALRGASTASPTPTAPSRPRWSSRGATSRTASCPTRPSTSSTRRAPAQAIGSPARPPELADVEKEIERLTEEKLALVSTQNYERAAEVRDSRAASSRRGSRSSRASGSAVAADGAPGRRRGRRPGRALRGDGHTPRAHRRRASPRGCCASRRSCTAAWSARTRRSRAIASAIRRSRAGVSDRRRPLGLLHLPRAHRRGQDPRRQDASPSTSSAPRTP
ncbi:MAG: UvrB/UvrC motif-containing protein [Bacillus subtilis]|nr:UvrB/UvrC motif-containing protein [Bacillus subtilis]